MEIGYWMILGFLLQRLLIINPKSQQKFGSNGNIDSKILLNVSIGKSGLYVEELIKNFRDPKEYLINFKNRQDCKK